LREHRGEEEITFKQLWELAVHIIEDL
jgi:hypothetical protein